jgi:hypothetical protein
MFGGDGTRTRAALLASMAELDRSYGRFMQPDPLGYADGLNWYAYVGGDPVNATDPSGTLECVATEVCVRGGRNHEPAGFDSSGGTAGAFSSGPVERGDAGEDCTECEVVVNGTRNRAKPNSLGAIPAPQLTIRCTGPAYVLKGNNNLIGKNGFTETPVTRGSAAVIPRQFTGQEKHGPMLRAIGLGARGTVTSADGQSQSFVTFTDSIADARLGTSVQAQNIIMRRHPGAVVFEIVGGQHYEVATFDIVIPNLNGCPVGSF